MRKANTRGGGRQMGSWFSDIISNPVQAIMAPVQAVQQIIPAPVAQIIAAPVQMTQTLAAQAPLVGQYVAPVVGMASQLIAPTAAPAQTMVMQQQAPPTYYAAPVTAPAGASQLVATDGSSQIMPAGWQDEMRTMIASVQPAGGVKPWMIGGGVLALAGIGALIWHSQTAGGAA